MILYQLNDFPDIKKYDHSSWKKARGNLHETSCTTGYDISHFTIILQNILWKYHHLQVY